MITDAFKEAEAIAPIAHEGLAEGKVMLKAGNIDEGLVHSRNPQEIMVANKLRA